MPTIQINRQWLLSDNQYYKEDTEKSNICLHHTVGGSAKSTFDYWQSNPDRIATSYLVDVDGTIYEVFDPTFWAHHLGLKMSKNRAYNQRTIGIELVSEGALKSGNQLNLLSKTNKFDPEFLYAFDIDVSPFPRAKKLYHIINDKHRFFESGLTFRGYDFFDLYDDLQVAAVTKLVIHLCEQFDIPKQLIPNEDKLTYDPTILTSNWRGIFTHTNVRTDKSDLSPAWDWTEFQKQLLL